MIGWAVANFGINHQRAGVGGWDDDSFRVTTFEKPDREFNKVPWGHRIEVKTISEIKSATNVIKLTLGTVFVTLC